MLHLFFFFLVLALIVQRWDAILALIGRPRLSGEVFQLVTTFSNDAIAGRRTAAPRHSAAGFRGKRDSIGTFFDVGLGRGAERLQLTS